MLESITIKGFKGIKTGIVSDLGQINIITGKNNQGKSAFLQSIYLLNKNKDQSIIPDFGTKEMFWMYDNEQFIDYQIEFNKKKFNMIFSTKQKFYQPAIDIRKHIESVTVPIQRGIDDNYYYLSSDFQYLARKDGGATNIGSIKNSIDEITKNFLKTMNSSILLNHYNFLARSDVSSNMLDKLQNVLQQEDKFLKILSETYDKKLTKLRHSPHEFGGWSIYFDDGKESRSISFDNLGDGSRTCINILLKMFVEKPKIILIDEIELHQHYKSLYYLCKTIVRYIKENNSQLFVSTHNLDAIKILSKLAEEYELSALVHHFTLKEGVLEARTIPSLDAETIIDLTGDIRSVDEYA